MTPAEFLYVGGMSVICIAFPTLLVGMMAWQSLQARLAPAKAPVAAKTRAYPNGDHQTA